MRTLITALVAFTGLWLSAQEVLTDEEAVRIAMERNYGIRIARLDARSAELLNTAGNAGMLPRVDAIGQYTMDNSSTKQTFFSGDVREADNADQRVLDAAVQLNWTIFDGLAMFATKDRLEALELLGQTRARQQMEATIYEVLANYYRLVQLNKALIVQQESVRISRERLSIAEAAKSIGTASGLHVVQARLDLSTDSAATLDLLAQRSTAMARLNALLGRDPATATIVDADLPVAATLDPAAIRTAARQANSTVQQARQQRIAADLGVKELRGALLPQVDIFANYGYTKSTSAVGLLQSNQALGPDYGARLSLPIFRGFQARSALDVAKLQREQADIGSQQAELDLEEGLLNAWTNFTLAGQRVALEEANLVGSRTQVAVALESFRLGAITSVELRDVQRGSVAAESRLLVAKYEAKLSELQLKWLAGMLVP